MDGSLSPDRKSFVIQFAAGKQMFGANAAGAPFHVYAPGNVPVFFDHEGVNQVIGDLSGRGAEAG